MRISGAFIANKFLVFFFDYLLLEITVLLTAEGPLPQP